MSFRHYIVEFFMRRTASTSLRSLTVLPPFHALLAAPVLLPSARVTSVGNRWRPHHGGSHERRIHGTPTCHCSPPRRPPRPAHLPGAGPHRGLVSQVVAPLSRGRRRWPVRPDAGTPRRPTHPARVGEVYPLRSPPAPGPHRAGHPLQPDRRPGHPGRTPGPQHRPDPQPAHHRARAPAQRLDGTPRPPGPAAAAAGLSRPAGAGLQRPPRGRSGRPIYLQGSGHRYYIWVGKDAFDGAVCLRLASSRRMDEVLWFLGECWKDLGLPAQVQFDHASEMAGWGREEGTLSRLMRLCHGYGV